MSVYSKKELVKRLNAYFSDKDLLYVIYFSKDEFESSFDKKIKKKDWEFAINNVDEDSVEQNIKEQIEQTLIEEMDLNEN